MRGADRLIERFGENVRVGDRSDVRKAFIQPILRRTGAYYPGQWRIGGTINDNRFYLVAKSDFPRLSEGDIIRTDFGDYVVRKCGSYRLLSNILYVWAVLTACTTPLEDDYD